MIPAPPEIDLVMDINLFMERAGQDRTFAKELADLFLMEAPRLLAAVMKASAEKDGAALWRAAHALKGAAATFSAPKAVRSAAALERMGHESSLAGVEQACTDLSREVACLCSELANISSV